jgi:hypothetical protein
MTIDRLLAISALVIAIPAGTLGTLLAPKLAQWWAKTSISRTRARITVLRRRLELRKQFNDDYFRLLRYLGMPFLIGCVGVIYEILFGISAMMIADYSTATLAVGLAKLPPDLVIPPFFQRVAVNGMGLAAFCSQCFFTICFLRLSRFVLSDLERELIYLEHLLSVDN